MTLWSQREVRSKVESMFWMASQVIKENFGVGENQTHWAQLHWAAFLLVNFQFSWVENFGLNPESLLHKSTSTSATPCLFCNPSKTFSMLFRKTTVHLLYPQPHVVSIMFTPFHRHELQHRICIRQQSPRSISLC